MQHRQLGTSDVKVSAITFGAWAIGGWMWGGQEESDAVAAIRKAFDCEITTIDTAAIYGFGRSERFVAKALEGINRSEVQILTKYGMRWDIDKGNTRWETEDNEGNSVTVRKYAGKESVIYECEQSLKRLRTDYIDLFQCHWRDETTPLDETMEAIDKLLADGKILAGGVSNFSVDDIAEANKAGKLASNQPPYSMINRDIDSDVLPYCIEHNIGILAYSPLQRGLLTGKITAGYKFPPGDHRSDNPFFSPENRKRVEHLTDKLRPIAEAHSATVAQLVINWTINRPGITAALVGARNAIQAQENAQAAELKFSTDEMQTINKLVENF